MKTLYKMSLSITRLVMFSKVCGSLISLLLFSTILQSCRKDKNYSVQGSHQLISGTYSDVDSNFVSVDFAAAIAQRLPVNYFEVEDKNYLGEGELREISSSFELKFEDDALPAGYVFNYANNEGFVIISADLRYEPILAFSSTGSLNQNDTIPDAMYEWAGYNIEVVNDIRQATYMGTSDAAILTGILQYQYNEWLNLFDNMKLGDPPTGFEKPTKWEDPTNQMNCIAPYYARKDFLLRTVWGQGPSYNNLVNSSLNCGGGKKPLTGCVPTATAQLLKYWSKPHSSYNYAAMPNLTGDYATQVLMRDLGTYLNVSYTCSGTPTSTHSIASVLRDKFNYVSPGIWGNYTNSSRWDVKSDLDAGRVVYVVAYSTMTTTTKRILGIFKKTTTEYGNAHAWLIDGYEAKGNICHQSFWYRMNWGWDGEYNAPWYFETNWQPKPGMNFQFQRSYVKNIHP